MTGAEPYVVGVDLGGTKIVSLAVAPGGRIVGRDRRSTEASQGPQAVIQRIVDSVRQAIAEADLRKADLREVGISAPGPCDIERGLLTAPPNLPGWRDVPLARIMSETLHVPTLLENDANAAAYGEHRFGAGRPYRHMIFITISTGIGGGIIVDGSIYAGASGAAGEVGHMILEEDGPPCGCGSRGCLEALASGSAIAREAGSLVAQGRCPLLARLLSEGRPLDAKNVHLAAQQGDADARAVIERAGRYLGLGLANIINILNPQGIILGGGLCRIGAMILNPARAVAREHAFAQSFADVSIVEGELGDQAGALGVAALAAERQRL
jgi:glucokinase